MARKTSLKTEPNGLLSLMDLAVDQLDAAIHRPSILSYKPYPAQLDFHKCELTGRYMSAGNRAGKTTAAVQHLERLLTAYKSRRGDARLETT